MEAITAELNDLWGFLGRCLESPALLITVILVLGVILVNGWTDAPNAIATVVSTGSMKPKSAILMAAALNFAGVLLMSLISSKVADTIYKMVDFKGDAQNALIALCASLFANVIIGLVLSTVLGFLMGYLIVKLVVSLCRHMDRRKTDSFFKGAQITGGAAMAFMHGAQDGQKFMGVFMLGSMLASGLYVPGGSFDTKIWLMLLCSVVMSLGTSIGGYRIIKSVGMDMIKLEKYQGFSADIAAALCLLLASLTGVPVSTTHTKTTAIMGVGAAKRLSAVNWGIVKEMVLAWVLTFPGCGLIGFIMAKLFMAIF